MNGALARLGESADPTRDHITLDGRPLTPTAPRYWILNKPRGVLTTRRDPFGRPAVLDLLPEPEREGLFPVGRLDRETEGLLLLTNDGELTQVLLHPSFETEKEYRVRVRGRVRPETLRRLEAGVELRDGRTAPARVRAPRYRARDDTTSFRLILHEGRKRQIRRSLSFLGHPVEHLARTRLGPLRLRDLAPGEARALRPEEIRALQRFARERRRSRGQPGRPQRAASSSKRAKARGKGARRARVGSRRGARSP